MLDEYLNHPLVKDREAKKYIQKQEYYEKEKNHIIKVADLKPNSSCLDISTGVGHLPYLLKQQGHTCDATDISSKMIELDEYSSEYTRQLKNYKAYEVLRLALGVGITQYLDVVPDKKIILPRKYDCIFSCRIVWYCRFMNEEQYTALVDNLLEYADKVVFKFNFDQSRWPSINSNKVDEQWIDGTLVCHK